jgi:NADH-quinone oxidoreductase subunit N
MVVFEPWMVLAILPEILLLVLALIVLVCDLVLPDRHRRNLGWVTAVGLGLIIIISLFVSRPTGDGELMWGGMLRHDWFGFTFMMVFYFAAGITALFSMDVPYISKRGEYYVLMLASTLGMSLMAASADLIMLYVAIELTSIPLYVLAGFLKQDDKSTEAGFKYLLFGAMTSAVMLYGLSLLYGFTGTTNIYALAGISQVDQLSLVALFGGVLLLLVGFGFKISVVPLHFWAPDVYEGSPSPIAGFLSTASKAAGFAVLVRVLFVAFPQISPYWGAYIAALAVATMTLGNLLALAQKNIKRMLAYSSIAHAGYALIGVVAITYMGVSSLVFYLITYVVTNLAAFGIVTTVGRIVGSDEIADYAGLSRRSPGLGLAMLVSFLSLAGMPPFGGFVIKFAVFAAAVNADMVWLAVIGILNSIIGLYYYLTVLKYVYLYRSEDEEKALPITRPYALGLVILCIGIVFIGVVFAPWYTISNTAAASIF